MKFSRENQDKAKTFIYSYARPLEKSLYDYYFEKGTAEDIFSELSKYQNPDGGFGHALEPDFRLVASSAMATSVGLQTLREFKAAEDHPMVQSVIRYLLDIYNSERKVWPIVPNTISEAPHAPWWQYEEDMFDGSLVVPRAEILGYLYDYSGLVPAELLDNLTEAVMTHLNTLPDAMDLPDPLKCYKRLMETKTLPEDARTRIFEKLKSVVDQTVVRDPSKWVKYCLKPLDVANSPDSPFATMLTKEIGVNLNYEIEHQQEDGSWAPDWTWLDKYPETWEKAEQEWKGILTLNMLIALKNYDRLE